MVSNIVAWNVFRYERRIMDGKAMIFKVWKKAVNNIGIGNLTWGPIWYVSQK